MILKKLNNLASKYVVLGARFSLLRLPLQGFFRRYFFYFFSLNLSAASFTPCQHCSLKNKIPANLCHNCSSILTDKVIFIPKQIKTIYILISTITILITLYIIIKKSNNNEDETNTKQSETENDSIDPKMYNALKVLGLNQETNIDEIRKRWKILLKKYHPDKAFNNDKNKKETFNSKTSEINNAYNYLTSIYQKR